MQYDISLPLPVMYQLVEATRQRCADHALCTMGYGHIGDGTSAAMETSVTMVIHLQHISQLDVEP